MVELDGQRNEGPRIIANDCNNFNLLYKVQEYISNLLKAKKIHETLSLMTFN